MLVPLRSLTLSSPARPLTSMASVTAQADEVEAEAQEDEEAKDEEQEVVCKVKLFPPMKNK